jgi:hypothetical protein
VLPPWGTTPMACAWQQAMSAESCATLAGIATAMARPW